MGTAIVNRFSGRAVVYEENGGVFVLEHLKNSGKPEDGTNIHLESFIQPVSPEFITNYNAGEFPYESLRSYLSTAYLEECVLTLIFQAVFPTETYRARRAAAEKALAYLRNTEIKEWVTARFKARSLPAIADIEGVPDPELKNFLKAFAAG